MIPLKQLEDHLIQLNQLGLIKIRLEEKGNSVFSIITTSDLAAENGLITLCTAKMKDGDSLVKAAMRHFLTADLYPEHLPNGCQVEPRVASMLEKATQINQHPVPRHLSFEFLLDEDNCREVEVFHSLPEFPHPGGIPSNCSSLFPGDEWVEEADKEGLFKKVATVLIPKDMDLSQALDYYAYTATQFDKSPAKINVNVDNESSIFRSTVIGDVFTCEQTAHVVTLCGVEPVKNFNALNIDHPEFHAARAREIKPAAKETLSLQSI
jgi:hypothetical protein